jgi:quinol monooxygenase YgiN
MAMGQILQFSGAGLDKYDAVRAELGWDGETNKPQGIVAHAAGSTDDGFCVIEWWESEAAWDTFFADRLRPAFEKVGDIPQPQVTRFEVHARYPA